jgi:hypothetical protein
MGIKSWLKGGMSTRGKAAVGLSLGAVLLLQFASLTWTTVVVADFLWIAAVVLLVLDYRAWRAGSAVAPESEP